MNTPPSKTDREKISEKLLLLRLKRYHQRLRKDIKKT